MSERPRFRLLGPLEVRDPVGAAIDLGGSRPRELLAYLLLHPRQAVTRDRLVATLWGDAASEGAATTLRTHIHAVRRVLARAGLPEALETRPGAYLLALEPEQIDVEVFEGLVHRGQEVLALGDAEESSKLFGDALSLWRDEPLSDLGPPDFARPTLTRCDELWLVAQEGQAAAQLALGRHRQVVGRLQELVDKHPFREELCALLMMALFRSGRQADALAAYAGARSRLADELGLDPGPRLRDLESAMLRQDPGLLPELPKTGIDVSEVSGAPTEDAVYAALRREAMAGRQTELALLDEAWRAASTGRAGVVTIAGPAGVGKSRLVAEIAHRAAADRATVLVGRCDDPTPGAALVSAFSSSPRVRTVLDAAPDVVRRLLGGIVPTGTEPAGEATDPQALHRAAEWLLGALLSGGPLLLVIEDAERLDEPASAMLRHLVVRARGSLLVIVCFRDPPGSRHQPLLELLGDGSVHGIARRIVLPPLDRAGVAAMIETHTGVPPADDVVAELATRTAGNPFFLHELLRDLDEQDVLTGRLSAKVPEGVRDVLRRRLRSLPEPTRAAVAGAAVLGRDVELTRLQRLLDEPEEQVVLALEAAVVAGFLVESGQSWAGGFAFPHELMREAVHDEIPVHRRQRLHLRAMDLLLAAGASEADFIAAADHAWNAGAAADPAETADLLDRAARLAAASYGFEEAIRFAENRLTLVRRTAPTDVQAGVAVDVARLRLRAGRGYERVLELFDDALAQYLAVGDTESAGAVHSRIGGTLALPRRGMDVTRSLDHFAAAEQLLAAPRDAFHLQRGRMSAAMHSLDSDLLADAADRCAAMAAELGRPDLASAAGWGHAWHAINGGRPASRPGTPGAGMVRRPRARLAAARLAVGERGCSHLHGLPPGPRGRPGVVPARTGPATLRHAGPPARRDRRPAGPGAGGVGPGRPGASGLGATAGFLRRPPAGHLRQRGHGGGRRGVGGRPRRGPAGR